MIIPADRVKILSYESLYNTESFLSSETRITLTLKKDKLNHFQIILFNETISRAFEYLFVHYRRSFLSVYHYKGVCMVCT